MAHLNIGRLSMLLLHCEIPMDDCLQRLSLLFMFGQLGDCSFS